MQAEEDAKDAKDALVKGGSPEDRLLNQKKLDSANFILNNKDKYASLEGTTSVVDQAKIDSNIGNALGIVENKQKGVSYTQNAMYSEESKQQGTHAKLKAQGGVDAAVATDVASETLKATKQQSATVGELSTFLQSPQGGGMNKKEADDMAQSIVNGSKQGGQEIAKAMMAAAAVAGTTMRAETATKTTSSMATVDANKTAGIIDKDGDITKEGKKALAVKPGQDAQKMMSLKEMGDRSEEIVEEIKKVAYRKAFSNTKDVDKAKLAANAAVEPYLDDDGKPLKGQNFLNKMASLQAGVFMGHNSILLGDNQIFSGALTPDGKITGNLSSGISSTETNSDIKTEGSQHVVKATDSHTKNLEAASRNSGKNIADVADQHMQNKADMDIPDRAKTYIAAKMAKKEDGQPEEGFLANYGEDIATGIGIAETAALGAAGINKVSKSLQPDKIPVTADDLSSRGFSQNDDGTYSDKKGNIYTEKDGKFYDSNNNVVKKDNPKAKSGVVKRGWDSVVEKTDELKSAISSPFSWGEQRVEESKQQDGYPTNETETKVDKDSFKQNEPPSSDTKESITKNSPTSKSIQSEIEAIEATDSKTAGRDKLSQLVEKQLKSATKGSSEEGALRKAQSALKGTGDVSAGLLNAGGITQDVLDENGVYTHQNEKGRNVVDFDSTGEYAKADQVMDLENQKVSAQAHESAMKGAQEKFHDPIAPRKAPIHTVGAVSDLAHLARAGGKFGLVVLAGAAIGSTVANA